jgi:hypothetical protein
MKHQKNPMVTGKSAGSHPDWNAKFGQILHPRRKRAWSSPAKMNSLAAINFGLWLKNYES